MEVVSLSSIHKHSSITLSNNALTATSQNINSYRGVRAELGKSAGKWYWEVKIDTAGNNSLVSVGVANESVPFATVATGNNFEGTKHLNKGLSWITGDTIGLLLDMSDTNGKLTFYKNGTYLSVLENIKEIGKVVFPMTGGWNSWVHTFNFGETPFTYPIPDGYKAYKYSLLNKSFILFGDGYKKLSKESPATESGNAIPFMTGDTSPSGVVMTSGFANSSYLPWYVFNDSASSWQSNTLKSGWIGYNFEKKTVIKSYTLKSTANLSSYMCKDWTFEGSNNGVDWTVIDARENQIGWAVAGEKREYSVSENENYLMYRINVSDIMTGNTNVVINRLEMIKPAFPKVTPTWQTVSPTLPTLPQFQSEGMDDLSIFDRKVQQVLESPQAMTSSVLGGGKVFKGSVDLKKYFDLRKLEVK